MLADRPLDAAARQLGESLRSSKAAVFCGAGISLQSGVPSVANLLPHLFRTLGITASDAAALAVLPLPFEVIMHTINRNTDILPLLEIFRHTTPNQNHAFLAELLSRGQLKTICTTNFDTLIEQALEAKGLEPGTDVALYRTDQELRNAHWKDNGAKVIKLHGSAHDTSSMILAIRQVARRVRSAAMRRALEHVFADGGHTELLVLGYSFSDVFDITPQLQRLPTKDKWITLVEHTPLEQRQSRIDPLESLGSEHPLQEFQGRRVRANTDVLVRKLYSLVDIPFPARTSGRAWRATVDAWVSAIPRARRLVIGGELLSLAGRSPKRYYEMALLQAKQEGGASPERLIDRLATVAHRNGDYAGALTKHKQALRGLKDKGDEEGAGNAHLHIAVCLRNLGLPLEALKHNSQALAFCQRHQLRDGQAACLLDQGLCHADLMDSEQAEKCFRQAIDISSDEGLRDLERDALGNLGSLFAAIARTQQSRALFKTALVYHEKAYRISVDLADQVGKATAMSNMAGCHHGLGAVEEAIADAERSLRISKSIGHLQGMGVALSNLGLFFLKQGEYADARSKLTEALKIARQIRDPGMEGTCLLNLGVVHVGKGSMKEGAAHFSKARVLFRSRFGPNHPHTRSAEAHLKRLRLLVESSGLDERCRR